MDADFLELVKHTKTNGVLYTDQHWNNLIQNTKANKSTFNWFYYIIWIFIIFILIMILIAFYYNLKPDTKGINDMLNDKNKSDGIDIIETDIEFDENGNEIMWVDDDE